MQKEIIDNSKQLKNSDIILANDITCVFNEKQKNEIVALNHISFNLERNKIHCIIGDSGSGKSSLVYHFNGLLKSKTGFLNIDNFLIDSKKKKIKNPKILRKKISIVFQFPEYQLFKDTIENDVCFGPNVLGIPKEKALIYNTNEIFNVVKNDGELFKQIKEKLSIKDENINANNLRDYVTCKYKYNKKTFHTKVKFSYNNKSFKLDLNFHYKTEHMISVEDAVKYLEKMGLNKSFLEKNPFGLSGGQKRRVAIAGILAIEPKILVFDEPTAGLDPKGEQEMMQTILNAKKSGQTVVVITHTMDHVLQIADKVMVLKKGEIFLQGKPYEVFTNKQLLKETKMELPKVIEFIDKLASKNRKFEKLYKMQPRTVEELADCIQKVLKG